MLRRIWILSALLLILAASSAYGDTLVWAGVGPDPQTLAGAYYVSPYYATDVTTSQPLTLYCVDFNHEIAPPYTWTANIYALTQANVAANAQYRTDKDAWDDYEEAAWLLENATLVGGPVTAQAAVWTLFVDTSHTGTLTAEIAAAGLTDAVKYALLAYDNAPDQTPMGPWSLVTGVDLDGAPTQEFLIDPSPVPEPASILLLGIVLVGCGRGLARRWS